MPPLTRVSVEVRTLRTAYGQEADDERDPHLSERIAEVSAGRAPGLRVSMSTFVPCTAVAPPTARYASGGGDGAVISHWDGPVREKVNEPLSGTPPEREPLGFEGGEGLLASLQCYTLGRLAHAPVRVAILGEFARCAPGEGGTRPQRAGMAGARQRHNSLLNLRTGDTGFSLGANIRPIS